MTGYHDTIHPDKQSTQTRPDKNPTFFRTMKLKLIPSILFAAFAAIAHADVPPIIHHQGVLLDGEGVPYDGPVNFRFALVNELGDTSHWSNDGTSVGGAAPAGLVPLPVSDGLFNAPLGDSDLGMLPIPADVFQNADVYLRIWVEDEQLSPDRRITSVGYAMMAAGVTDGAITSDAIPSDTIQSHHIVDHAVTSDDLAPAITLESLNLEHNNSLRTELSSNLGGRLRLWDGLDTMTAYLGTTAGGGDLNLFQINGNLGIKLDGDAATYDNASSAGGEVTIMNSGGFKGVFLDGQNNGGGRIEVHQSGSLTPYVDVLAKGNNDGAEIRVQGRSGVNGVEIFGANDSQSNPDARGGSFGGPGGEIKLYQPGGLGAVLYGSANVGGGALSLRDAAGNSKFVAYGGPHSARLLMGQSDGVVGIEANAAQGDFGEARFIMRQNATNDGAVATVQIDGGSNDISDGGGRLRLRTESNQLAVDIDASASGGNGKAGSHIRLRNSSNQVTVEIDAADADGNGLVRTQVLEITGGSDLSEQFNINAPELAPEPGMLVSIDPENPGELVLSTAAYDRTAAGVISGAGGVNPGMLMGQTGSIADGDYPVALTGRVYCYVDASHGAIEPGDLITTSPTAGHGMKVADHGRAQGAIVGKAMTSLKEGRGLVLVLVSLQ